jgi:hypothetical protein
MLQYRLQPVGNFRCDYATGADFCDAFVTSTDSSYLLAFLLTANHEAAESCFVAALDQAFKANAVFKEWATSWILVQVPRIVDWLFGKWRICHEVGKIRRREPLDVTNAEISENVVYGGHRLLANDVAEAPFELGLECQARKFTQDRTLFVLRDSIEAHSENVYRDA